MGATGAECGRNALACRAFVRAASLVVATGSNLSQRQRADHRWPVRYPDAHTRQTPRRAVERHDVLRPAWRADVLQWTSLSRAGADHSGWRTTWIAHRSPQRGDREIGTPRDSLMPAAPWSQLCAIVCADTQCLTLSASRLTT